MPRQKKENTEAELRAEIHELRTRLIESEDTLDAIRHGEVDAIVVSGEDGDKIFALASSETPYRVIIENIDEGALTMSASGIILFCNRSFSEIVEINTRKIIGAELSEFVSDKDLSELKRLISAGITRPARGEVTLKGVKKTVRLSLSPLPSNIEGDICIIVSDITEVSNYQNYLRKMVDERTSELRVANMQLHTDLEKLRTAEQALLESERLFRSAFDEGAAPMTLTSHEGRFLRVNRAFCKLTGYSEEELLKMSLKEITHEDDLGPTVKGRKEIEKSERISFGIEKRYIRKDGRSVWVSINTAPVLDEAKNWDFIVSHVQNINTRKLAESRLKESKERFRQLANSIPQLAWIARSDGYIFWFNHRWYEYTGKTPEDMVGLGWHSVLHPDTLKTVLGKWKKNIAEAKPTEMVSLLLGRDGRYREFLTKSIPIIGRDGLVEQWFGTHTDISELKKVENELMNSKEKLNMALENGQIGTWEWNMETSQVTWDARTEKMFGFEPGTFDGSYETFESCIHEEDLPHLRKAIKRSLDGDQPFESMYRTRTVNGSSSFISAKAVVNHNENGKAIGMSGVCFDVTGMKKDVEQALIKINEELLRSNTDLQQFAYVASHDLQEPLRMVSSFTQLLQQRYGDKLGVDGKEFIHYAVEGSKRMYQLLNGLLAYSRVQTRGREFTRVDMNSVVDKVKENLNLIIAESDASINSVKLPQIAADENQMIQLVQNLFENSIKFRKGHPEISVGCSLKDDFYIFTVKDKGIGIEPQYFERIFRIFQRLHHTGEYEGTGIGLAICKRIVERHNGKIWVESEFGKSTTFHFSIPVTIVPTGSILS